MKRTLLLMLGMLACVEQQEQPTMTIHEYCRQYADTYFQETSPNEKIEYMQGLIRNEQFMYCLSTKGFQ